MDVYRFSLQIDGFEHETTFHFCWNNDRYEAYVIMYHKLHCFDMIQVNGKWEFVNEEKIPILIDGKKETLAGACENHYERMKAFLKK
jgi:hypothetical protein